jgi:hypothetical protein
MYSSGGGNIPCHRYSLPSFEYRYHAAHHLIKRLRYNLLPSIIPLYPYAPQTSLSDHALCHPGMPYIATLKARAESLTLIADALGRANGGNAAQYDIAQKYVDPLAGLKPGSHTCGSPCWP